MTKAKKTAASKKSQPVTDVAHPDTSLPSDTSKPIIMPRAIMKDPMVVEDKQPEDEEKSLSVKTGETKITPLSEQKDDEPDDEAKDKPEAKIDTKNETGDEQSDETSGEDKPDAKPGKSKKDKAVDEARDAVQAEADAKTQELVESKQYFLPINAVEHRKTARFAAAGIVLVLLLVVAWADVALDAGLISIPGLKAPTHFFSQAPASPASSAATSPSEQFSTYTTTSKTASFKYPKSWKTSESKLTAGLVKVSPPAGSKVVGYMKFQPEPYGPGGTNVIASRPITKSTDPYIDYVHYQKLPSAAADVPLYVQEFILKFQIPGAKTKYYTYINLVPAQSLKTGQTVSPQDALGATFTVNGSEIFKFGGELDTKDSSGDLAASSLTAAKDFMNGNAGFKQAKAILLSFKAPKR